MQRITLPKAFRSAWLAFAFAVTLLLLNLSPQGSFFSQAQAQTNTVMQCTAPQPSSGCASCGCGSCGCGGDVSIPHCPTGYSSYDDFCLPDCPQDFIRYPGLPGLCMPPVHYGCGPGYDQVPLPQCPQGYYRDLRNPDLCVADIDYGLHQGVCPQGMGWSYDHGRCEADCPQGTYRDGHGLCQSYYSQECPKDFVHDPASGKCLPPGIWPPNYTWVCLPTCPPGTLRDIRHPTLCLPPPPSCPQGFDNVGGRCLPICDKGLQRDPYGYCVPVTCPDGGYTNLRGQCQFPECPEGTRRNDRGECLPPPHICDQGQESINGQCTPICRTGLSRDAKGNCTPDQANCPQGQRLNSDTGNCERIPPNTPNCNPNQIYSSVLRHCTDIPPPVHCGQGQYKNSDGRCVDIPQPPPQLQPICPQGTRPDGQGGCVRISVPSNCPPGLFYDRRTNRCTRPNFVPGGPPLDQGGNTPPPRTLQQLNPNLPPQLVVPHLNAVPGINVQQPCPDGTARDNNGRCAGPNIR